MYYFPSLDITITAFDILFIVNLFFWSYVEPQKYFQLPIWTFTFILCVILRNYPLFWVVIIVIRAYLRQHNMARTNGLPPSAQPPSG